MKEENESVFKENASPTCFAIDESGSCCVIGFDDGDLVVFDIFQQAVMMKYLQTEP